MNASVFLYLKFYLFFWYIYIHSPGDFKLYGYMDMKKGLVSLKILFLDIQIF